MALLYADENFDYPIVEHLRQLGHDVVTVQEAGRTAAPDPEVLADATGAGRAVITFNRRHFERLHRQGNGLNSAVAASLSKYRCSDPL